MHNQQTLFFLFQYLIDYLNWKKCFYFKIKKLNYSHSKLHYRDRSNTLVCFGQLWEILRAIIQKKLGPFSLFFLLFYCLFCRLFQLIHLSKNEIIIIHMIMINWNKQIWIWNIWWLLLSLCKVKRVEKNCKEKSLLSDWIEAFFCISFNDSKGNSIKSKSASITTFSVGLWTGCWFNIDSIELIFFKIFFV